MYMGKRESKNLLEDSRKRTSREIMTSCSMKRREKEKDIYKLEGGITYEL